MLDGKSRRLSKQRVASCGIPPIHGFGFSQEYRDSSTMHPCALGSTLRLIPGTSLCRTLHFTESVEDRSLTPTCLNSWSFTNASTGYPTCSLLTSSRLPEMQAFKLS